MSASQRAHRKERIAKRIAKRIAIGVLCTISAHRADATSVMSSALYERTAIGVLRTISAHRADATLPTRHLDTLPQTCSISRMDRQFKRTPPRLSRIFDTYSPPLYFITFNTHLRTAILANESVHDTWKAFCQNASVRRIGVGRYVIMPDHIHCFVRMSGESSLGEWVKVLKQTLGKTLKTLGHTPANLPGQSLSSYWQPGFFDHLMRHSESYSEKCDYVYQNPVRAGLVANPEDWPYQGEIGVLRM